MSMRTERKTQIKQAIVEKVLELAFQGQSFSSISLRQLAREIGVVPSALYRYFKDKDELAQVLIDHVSLLIKSTLFQFRLRFISDPDETPEQRMEMFFALIETHASYWHFFAAERWGGYTILEEIIKLDAVDLMNDFIKDLNRLPDYKNIPAHDINMYAELVLQLCFTWSMDWIELCRAEQTPIAIKKKKRFIQNCSQKVTFLKNALNTTP